MGVDKEGSKGGGGYVGGFFQLFDWTAKSRKKLFSSKSEQPERTKQGKRSDGNLPMTRLHLMEENDIAPSLNVRGGYSDYSCSSSVTDDEGNGARVPGVVARLMGLDYMPTCSFFDANSTPYFDTQSLRDASQRRKQNCDYYHDHQIMYSGSLLGKEDAPPRNFIELKPQKVLSRPIEKFQTEVLPPKSAKSIPVTHHKLLSPIKSPGFIPSKSAAHIMEAAAKIIESSPQPLQRAKMPSIGSSSVPLKVRDLKEKLELSQKMSLVGSSTAAFRVRGVKEEVEAAPRTSRIVESSLRPAESNAVKCFKGQSLDRSWNGSADTNSLRAFADTEEVSSGIKSRGKSISLAIQAKVNVQRREGLNSSGQGLVDQKEQSEEMSIQHFKSQQNNHKTMQKKTSTFNSSGVLRPNNQKQNCITDKEKPSSKPSTSSLQGRKTPSANPSSGRQKISSKTVGPKVGSRKMGSEIGDGEKGISPYSTRNTPRKKRLIDGNMNAQKARAVDHMLIDSDMKSSETNSINDKHFGWAEESKRKGMDVVSFTFTAPLTRSSPGSETGSRVLQKSNGPSPNDRGKRLLNEAESMKLSSVGYNVIGGDALSTLLEQKLRELTSATGTSKYSINPRSAPCSASFVQDAILAPEATSGLPNFLCGNRQDSMRAETAGSFDSSIFSTEKAEFRLGQTLQAFEAMEECSSKQSDCRRPSPVSVLDHSFSTASSLDSAESSFMEASKLPYWSTQGQEIFGCTSSKNIHIVDTEMELSDSASSTLTAAVPREHPTSFATTEFARSTNGDLDYVAMILSDLELLFQDFSLGQTSEIISPHLFDQLESQKYLVVSSTRAGEDKLERRLLFDCVGECLDVRCRRYIGGGYRTWEKGVSVVRMKERLVEEVHRDISMWRGMGDCMVDELVDKDMSSQHGRWLDFEVDAFSIGAEVESQIFESLVDDLVADLFPVYSQNSAKYVSNLGEASGRIIPSTIGSLSKFLL